MSRIYAFFFVLLAVTIGACMDKSSLPHDQQTAGIEAKNPPYFMDDSSEVIDFDAIEVRNIKEAFDYLPESKTRALSEYEDDRFCAEYTKIANMGIALGKSDFLWKQAGLSKEAGLQMYADSSALLTQKMEEFIILSDDDLILRIATWRHSCDGMFNPVARDQFINEFTRLHIDAGIPRPFTISPQLKSALLRHYRKQIRDIGSGGLLFEEEAGGPHSQPSLHAFYWFTLKELTDTANVK